MEDVKELMRDLSNESIKFLSIPSGATFSSGSDKASHSLLSPRGTILILYAII
jgi:hypothetical protein